METPTQACDDATGNVIPLDPANFTGFEIDYGTDPNSPSGSLIVPPTYVTAEIDGLAPGTYYVSICSLDSTNRCGMPTTNCPTGGRTNTFTVDVP